VCLITLLVINVIIVVFRKRKIVNNHNTNEVVIFDVPSRSALRIPKKR